MAYPASVHIQEVGPRDGLQIEQRILSAGQRAELINSLADAGLTEIEVGSFVNPKAVPQMAGTDGVLSLLESKDGVAYRGLWLNEKGLHQALAAPRLAIDGYLQVSASDLFSQRNTGKTSVETMAAHDRWIDLYQSNDIPTATLVLMAAFGCNFEGPVSVDQVLGIIGATHTRLAGRGEALDRVVLADTMGWASPTIVRGLVSRIRDLWPELCLRLHLHDTRGLALANALVALELGVTEFDAAIGGLGGCPFSGSRGAVGNMCTEDFVFLCHELGIETGIDLERLIGAANRAEELVGRELPGRLMKAGVPSVRTVTDSVEELANAR